MCRVCFVLFFAATFSLWSSHQVFAAPSSTVSLTAEAVCEFRAIAAQHPDRTLRSKDTLAAKLCSGNHILPSEYGLARPQIDRDPQRYSGFFYVNARTHHIDSQLDKSAKEGITQVVVLGAGFDSRAYRFHDIYPKLEFFEVDLPVTINAKQQAVTRMLGGLPRHVHYAPIDFETQSLENVLPEAGYDSSKKTLFIIEGVLMYVNEAGNNATFAFIQNHSPSGSMVVYDYILRRVAEGDYNGLYAAASMAKDVESVGEPFVTGWTPGEAANFAARHGLTVLEDLDSAELTRRYLTDFRGKVDGRLPDWQRIIDAKVR